MTFILSDNSAVQVPDKIPLPSTPGTCADCFVVQGGSQNLKALGSGDNSTTPVLVSVEGAPSGTTVAVSDAVAAAACQYMRAAAALAVPTSPLHCCHHSWIENSNSSSAAHALMPALGRTAKVV